MPSSLITLSLNNLNVFSDRIVSILTKLFRKCIFFTIIFSISKELIFEIIIPKIYVTNISVRIKNQFGNEANVSLPNISLKGIKKVYPEKYIARIIQLLHITPGIK
jgi:hypothetical protein